MARANREVVPDGHAEVGAELAWQGRHHKHREDSGPFTAPTARPEPRSAEGRPTVCCTSYDQGRLGQLEKTRNMLSNV